MILCQLPIGPQVACSLSGYPRVGNDRNAPDIPYNIIDHDLLTPLHNQGDVPARSQYWYGLLPSPYKTSQQTTRL